jgi:MoxR-like ATPase
MAKSHLTPAPDAAAAQRALIDRVIETLQTVIVGKAQKLRLAVACMLAEGHLLIEDLPGVGKTTLAHALARALGLGYQRIQFTSDLLPADILGVSVYQRDQGNFEFHRGPIFSQVVLGDEINRATPKAQSALLEAMEERQVTADGKTYALPAPFFVIATQNPQHQIGTFPLPESQLDRFLMQIELGYPDPGQERILLAEGERRRLIDTMQPALTADSLLRLQERVPEVHVSEPLLDYVQALIRHTRESGDYLVGLSPRGGMALVKAAQAWALMEGHPGVHPEDVQAIFAAVVDHRLERASRDAPTDPGRAILSTVPVP